MLTSMLKEATSKSFGTYNTRKEVKYVAALDLSELRKRLTEAKARAQSLDVRIQVPSLSATRMLHHTQCELNQHVKARFP